MSIFEGYKDSLWFRSLIQAVPYIGPLIDNILTAPQSQREKANIDAFLKTLSDDIAVLKKSGRLQHAKVNEQQPFILQSVIDAVRNENNLDKIAYYQHIFYNYELYRSLDGSEPIDVFPQHFLKIVNEYTMTHLRVMRELHELYLETEWVMIENNEFTDMRKYLNIPGGCLFKILNDFERDHLVDIDYLYGNKKSHLGLNCIKLLQQTFLWDEFFVNVIEPPLWLKT